MDMLIPTKKTLFTPNEPTTLLTSIMAAEGDAVEKGQILALIESTRHTSEIVSEATGCFAGLHFQAGDCLKAGEVLAYIFNAPHTQDPSLPPWLDDTSVSPVDREVVRDFLSRAEPGPAANNPEGDKRLVIYGAGGHGRALAALVRDSEDYQIVGFLDDGLSVGTQVDDWQVLGGGEKLTELAQAGIHLAINGVGGITDRSARLSVYDQLSRAGFHCPTVIHRTSFLEDSCDYADGVQIFPFVYVGTQVKVGYGCILNTGAIVSHDCTLADYVTLSPGATLAGGVTIGEATLIGMRATVNLDLHIGKRAVIGNGATVKADVPDECVVHAGTIWPPRH